MSDCLRGLCEIQPRLNEVEGSMTAEHIYESSATGSVDVTDFDEGENRICRQR